METRSRSDRRAIPPDVITVHIDRFECKKSIERVDSGAGAVRAELLISPVLIAEAEQDEEKPGTMLRSDFFTAFSTVKKKKAHRFQCTQCPKSFRRRHHHDNHQRTHDPNAVYTCAICYVEYRKLESLTIHKSRKHGLAMDNRPLNDNVQFKCDKCSRKYRSETELTRHKYYCLHKERRGKKKLKKALVVRLGLGSQWSLKSVRQSLDTCCRLCCDVPFASRQSLFRHFDRIHKAESEQLKSESLQYDSQQWLHLPFGCEQCGKRFTTMATLSQHRRRHDDIRPFECELCGRRYVLMSELRKHRKKSHQNNTAIGQLKLPTGDDVDVEPLEQ